MSLGPFAPVRRFEAAVADAPPPRAPAAAEQAAQVLFPLVEGRDPRADFVGGDPGIGIERLCFKPEGVRTSSVAHPFGDPRQNRRIPRAQPCHLLAADHAGSRCARWRVLHAGLYRGNRRGASRRRRPAVPRQCSQQVVWRARQFRTKVEGVLRLWPAPCCPASRFLLSRARTRGTRRSAAGQCLGTSPVQDARPIEDHIRVRFLQKADGVLVKRRPADAHIRGRTVPVEDARPALPMTTGLKHERRDLVPALVA